DRKLLTILSRQFYLTLVRKIPEASRSDERLAHSVTFVRRNFLRSLAFDRAVNINSTTRFLADPIDRKNHRGMIIVFFFQQRLDRVSKFFARFPARRNKSDVRHF